MAKRKDSAVRVIEFFETTDLAAAQQALALSKRVVDQRTAAAAADAGGMKPRRRKRRAKKGADKAGGAGKVGGDGTSQGAPVSLRPKGSRSKAATGSADKGPTS